MIAARTLALLTAFAVTACSSSDSSTQPSFSPEMVAAAGSYQLNVANGTAIPTDLGAVSGTVCPHVIADGGILTLSYAPSSGAHFSLTMTAHGTCNGQSTSGGDLGFGLTGTWSLVNGVLTMTSDPTTNTFRVSSASYSGDGVTVVVGWSFPQTTLKYTR